MPMDFEVKHIAFSTREYRSIYVADTFKDYLQSTVLDVGCFEAPLRTLLNSQRYVGVDFAGNPDMKLNLDKIEKLPFEDGQFETVISIDVLEHLDNLHLMFDEIVRVAKKNIIISLPNCWGDARRSVDRGEGRFAHYGLPLDAPKDRHRWFFSLSEAKAFLVGKSVQKHLEIKKLFVTEKPRNRWVQWIRKMRYTGMRYLNRYSRTIWVVYEKK